VLTKANDAVDEATSRLDLPSRALDKAFAARNAHLPSWQKDLNDLSGSATPHEVGHMLGLTDSGTPGSLIASAVPGAPRQWVEQEQHRIDAAVNAELPGLRFPTETQSQPDQSPQPSEGAVSE